MASEWIEAPASEYCDSVRDGTHDSPKQVESGKLLVTSRHITGNRLDLSSAYMISDKDYEEINRRSEVDQWDVLFTMIGTVGEPCLVSAEPNYAIKNIGLFKNKTEVRGKYLYYYLCSPEAQHHTKAHSRGTTQQYIPLGALRKFPIRYPEDENEMLAITNILGSLDDKIELNRRMNETLEGMAQALFKSWFVDFDPVIDNALEAGNPIPEEFAARARLRQGYAGQAETQEGVPTIGKTSAEFSNVRKNFPDSFQSSELGPIPAGWEERPISEYFRLLGGHSFKSGHYVEDGAYGVVTIKNVQDGSFVQNCANRITVLPDKIKEHCLLDTGDVLLSLTGNVGRVCLVSGGSYVLNQRVSKIVGVDGISEALAYFYFRQKPLYERMITIAKGTAQLNLSPIETAKLTQVMPDRETIKSLSVPLNSYYKKMIGNILKNQTLSKLRDTLLPKLISGELRLPAASVAEFAVQAGIEGAEKMINQAKN